MGDSWYDYAENPERWNTWSALPELPEAGESQAFDKLLELKGLEREDLLRIGAKWGAIGRKAAIVYLFPDGLKYRALDGTRATEPGVTWLRSKIIPSQTGSATELVVAEGETDGALLSRIAGDKDVAILPAGAKTLPPEDDFSGYERVYVALDDDAPGNEGSAKLLAKYPKAIRALPPEGFVDWCDARPGVFEPRLITPPRLTFSVGDIIEKDFGTERENNWFAHGIIPRNGLVAVHGPMKSLKSVITMELARAIATGTDFAEYVGYYPDAPGKVVLLQFEIPPWQFQQRLLGMRRTMPPEDWELFTQNLSVFGVGDGKRPRLKITEPGFLGTVTRACEEAEAQVVIFDPIQRMTGDASTDKSNEMEPLLDAFSNLQNAGFTVVFAHHDTKALRNTGSPYAMSGTQRFGADVDSICSVYHDKSMIQDGGPAGIKQRNFSWELRNGVCPGRGVMAAPDLHDPDFMHVTWSEPHLGVMPDEAKSAGLMQPAIT